MKPQVVTIHKIFSDANMPPKFDEIDEKEGSNDDSDGEDHRRFNLESPRLLYNWWFQDAFKSSLKSFMKNKRDDAMVRSI